MQQLFKFVACLATCLSPNGRRILLLSLLLPPLMVSVHSIHATPSGVGPAHPPLSEEFHMTRSRKLRGEILLACVAATLTLPVQPKAPGVMSG